MHCYKICVWIIFSSRSFVRLIVWVMFCSVKANVRCWMFLKVEKVFEIVTLCIPGTEKKRFNDDDCLLGQWRQYNNGNVAPRSHVFMFTHIYSLWLLNSIKHLLAMYFPRLWVRSFVFNVHRTRVCFFCCVSIFGFLFSFIPRQTYACKMCVIFCGFPLKGNYLLG